MSKKKAVHTLFSFGIVKKRKIDDESDELTTNSLVSVSSQQNETLSVFSAPLITTSTPTTDTISSMVDIAQETLSDDKLFTYLTIHYVPTAEDLKIARQEVMSGSRKGSFLFFHLIPPLMEFLDPRLQNI